VPVEVVRPRTQAPRQRFSPGPVRNWAVGGRDLLEELNMWVRSLPERPTQVRRELGLILHCSNNYTPPPLHHLLMACLSGSIYVLSGSIYVQKPLH
jgi:hypothetical protein